MSQEVPPAQGESAASPSLAGYLIGRETGRGGMAVVYLAHDPRLDRPVALKVLDPELARDEAFRMRFIQESRAAAAVDHPNIIPVFDAGESDGVLYLAMRYVPGGDVRTLLDRDGPLPAERACSLVTQVASALDTAHARGLIHRDVKPTNMLLEPSPAQRRPDHVYLSDFGLAKQSVAASALTMTGQFVGTVDYVSPEQADGRPLDGRADQYALACASFEMLCGYPPFRRESAMAVISAHLADEPPWLTALRPELPAAADQVLGRALAKDPDQRYQRCLDFAEALTAACVPQPPAADVPAQHAGPAPFAGAAAVPGPLAAPGPADHPTREFPAGEAGGIAPGWQAGPAGPGPGGPGGPAGPAGYRGPAPRRRRRAGLVAAVSISAVLVMAAVGAALVHGSGSPRPPAAATPPAASAPATTAPATTSPARPAPARARPGPAATVRAYISAINHRDYRRAWRLGGRNTGTTYQRFAAGFRTTARDALTVLSVSRKVVTARITARQTDGTVHTYQGSYTVSRGIITRFRVRRLG